jgi:hypothetical protein
MSKSDHRWEQYIALDDNTDRVNQAIILLKKAYLLSTEKENPPQLVVSKAEILFARNTIRELFRFIFPTRREAKGSPYAHIPEPEATQLRQKLDDLLPRRGKMTAIEKAIDTGTGLTHYHFSLLDDLVTALDEERSLIIQILGKTKA